MKPNINDIAYFHVPFTYCPTGENGHREVGGVEVGAHLGRLLGLVGCRRRVVGAGGGRLAGVSWWAPFGLNCPLKGSMLSELETK
jgi:hypothetical protein